MEAIDAWQHREAFDAARAYERPNRPQPHLPAAKHVSTPSPIKGPRYVLVRIDLDGAAGDCSLATHAERFAVALDRGSVRRQGRAVDALRLIRDDIRTRQIIAGKRSAIRMGNRDETGSLRLRPRRANRARGISDIARRAFRADRRPPATRQDR